MQALALPFLYVLVALLILARLLAAVPTDCLIRPLSRWPNWPAVKGPPVRWGFWIVGLLLAVVAAVLLPLGLAKRGDWDGGAGVAALVPGCILALLAVFSTAVRWRAACGSTSRCTNWTGP